jgi:beta-lactamase class A
VTLIVNTPQPFEASPGLVRGVAPAGTHHVTLYAHGREIARTWLHRGKRRFVIAAPGLPTGDQTIDVAAYSRTGRRLGQTRVANVYGLPAAAFTLRPATTTDGAVQRALSGLRSQPGATDGVWVVDLRTGRGASWNAGAQLPAASTLKLAILMTVLSREAGSPTLSSAWPTERRLVFDSSNRAANELLVRIGGSTVGGSAEVNRLAAALGATRTDMFGGYLLEPGEDRRAGRASPFAAPPALPTEQPYLPRGKRTTAHDLGVMLSALMLAAAGRGPAIRQGISPHEARVALWLLLHARYPGLVQPNTPYRVAHKAGWLGQVQHDGTLVFRTRGTLLAAIMTYRAGGVSYTASRAYAARVLRLAARL